MADIVDRLNRLSDALIGLNLDMKLPPNSIDPREAADEIERLRLNISEVVQGFDAGTLSAYTAADRLRALLSLHTNQDKSDD